MCERLSVAWRIFFCRASSKWGCSWKRWKVKTSDHHEAERTEQKNADLDMPLKLLEEQRNALRPPPPVTYESEGGKVASERLYESRMGQGESRLPTGYSTSTSSSSMPSLRVMVMAFPIERFLDV
jgi:hypothetical protein